ncbi:hypothetical protein ABIA39_005862 [Nocardia sp. GAS34]
MSTPRPARRPPELPGRHNKNLLADARKGARNMRNPWAIRAVAVPTSNEHCRLRRPHRTNTGPIGALPEPG